MINWSNHSIPFWKDFKSFDGEFVLLSDANDCRDGWVGNNKPSMSEIINELSISRMSYVLSNNSNGALFIQFLAGRIIVSGRIDTEKKIIFLNKKNGFINATNLKRQVYVRHGIRIKHNGIKVVNGNSFRVDYEQKIWSKDVYIKKVLTLFDESKSTQTYEPPMLEDDQLNMNTSSECRILLDTLEAYVNTEYELEQIKAMQEAPFLFTSFKPEAKKSTYRYYFRADIQAGDISRMRNLNPSLLQIKSNDDSMLQFEVVDLPAEDGSNFIILSSQNQIDKSLIEQSGELFLATPPTLKNVRNNVIANLRSSISPNKWLIPLAAGAYQPTKTIQQDIPDYDQTRPLNLSQLDGIKKGAGSTDYTLILGPPGTGKTTVILSLVKFFASKGMRILVTSQNNKAVDNVLERLAQEKDLECVRVGNEAKVSSSIHDLLIDNYAINIQKKIFNRTEEILIELQASHDYLIFMGKALRDLKEYNEKLKTYKKNKIRYESELDEKQKVHDRYKNEQISLKENIEEILKTISELDYKLENIESKSWFMKLFSLAERTTYNIRKQYYEKQFNDKKPKLEAINQIINTVFYEISKLGDELKRHLFLLDETIKKEPQVPAYVKCAFINDIAYKFFNSQTGDIDLVIDKTSIDAQFYYHLLKIIKEWQASINSERQSSLYETLLEFVDVVGATCIGINSNKMFQNIPFDVTIVDESGQIQLHNLIVPLSRAPKAILVGDHKQLPPIIDDILCSQVEEQEFDVEFLRKSWFELLWDTTPEDHKTILDTQFRCPSIISDFVSEAFYESKYYAGKGMELKKPIHELFGSTMAFIDTSRSANNLETSKKSDDRIEVIGNKLETKIIVNLLEFLLMEFPYLATENEIGIIVPYANHVLEVKQAIKSKRLNLENIQLNEVVASVDSYQGQERDVIIFAFSRSNLDGRVGFLSDWRRLNVAMTRTKKQLIMVGNMNTLTKYRKSGSNDEAFKEAMNLLKVKMENQIYSADNFINRKGFTVEAL